MKLVNFSLLLFGTFLILSLFSTCYSMSNKKIIEGLETIQQYDNTPAMLAQKNAANIQALNDQFKNLKKDLEKDVTGLDQRVTALDKDVATNAQNINSLTFLVAKHGSDLTGNDPAVDKSINKTFSK